MSAEFEMPAGSITRPSPIHGKAGALMRRVLAPQVLFPSLAVLVGIVLVAGPFAATAIRSVLVGEEGHLTYSLHNFSALFHDVRFYRALGNTAIAGTATMILSCVFGFTLSWIVARTDVPGKAWLDTLNLVPFFLSPYVGAVSWTYLAAPHAGLLNHIIHNYLGGSSDLLNIFSMVGVIWVLALFYTPYIYLFLIGPMRRMDPSLEDAARVHGAGFWATMRYVTTPLMFPALMSGALIVFVTSAGLFDVPMALAAPSAINMIPTTVYQAVSFPTDYGRAAAIGVLVLITTVLFALFQLWYMRHRSFTTVSGKGYRPRIIRLGKWRIAALMFELFYIGSGVVLPLVALGLVSLSELWTGWPHFSQFTLANYDQVLFHYSLTQRAVKNSIFVAVVGATIAIVLSVLQAHYLRRGRGRLRALVNLVLSLPLGIPGIIVALGFLILLIRTPLYGTLWIIIVAYVARFMPFATRNVCAMFVSIGSDLEESARANGASWFQAMRGVLMPLAMPAIVAAWLTLFVIFIRELGSTILLYAQGTETMSVAMVILGAQNFGYVAALAVVQAVILASAFYLVRRLHSGLLQS